VSARRGTTEMPGPREGAGVTLWRLSLGMPLALLLVALSARAVVAANVSFPASEDSAYYVAVARNLVEGHGLTIDALWSYATPPLTLPRPAFDLWMPMATFISAVPMAVAGTTFASAQWGSVAVGALIAPLTWAVTRQAAVAIGLTGTRRELVAFSGGALVALLGPFLTAAALPDSTTPFLIFGVLAAVLVPGALRAAQDRRWSPGLVLGAVLGLGYLSRSEALWLGVAFVILALRHEQAAGRFRWAALARTLGPVIAGGALVVSPWLVRNAVAFGSPLSGQAVQNALLTRNEQVFAWSDPPTLDAFLNQGIAGMAGNIVAATWHQLVDVLLVPAFPVGLVGLLAAAVLWRRPAVRQATALSFLLLGGLLTFVATAVLFPVATLWGTFLHASGPLLAGLCAAAVLGADAAIGRLARLRGWPRSNAWLATAALLSVAVPLAAVEVAALHSQASDRAGRIAAVAAELAAVPELPAGAIVVSNHPIWMADALGVPVIALPDEPPTDIARLAATFHASAIVVMSEGGGYPDDILRAPSMPCSFGVPIPIGTVSQPAWLVQIRPTCPA
jgi:hypothetical protein